MQKVWKYWCLKAEIYCTERIPAGKSVVDSVLEREDEGLSEHLKHAFNFVIFTAENIL